MRWPPEKIKELRERYGETQAVFRLRLGITVTTLANWEQGRFEPTGTGLLMLDRLAEDLEAGQVRNIDTGKPIKEPLPA